MATLVASLYGVLDLEDRLTPGLKKAHGALDGLSGALKTIGAGIFFGKLIHETAEAEGAMAQLDAVLKSTSASMTKAATAGGHWATVTKQSGDYVGSWKKSLDSALATMDKVHAQQAAGIPLTKAQTEAYKKADAAQQSYGNALAGATTKHKVWVDAMQSGNVVTHMTRNELIKMADAFSKTTKFSDEQVIRSEAMLLTFTKIGKEVFPEATEAVLDMSEAMGQDWKSSAIQIGKALNDPIEGLTALRRVGVTFSNEQQRMIKQLVKSGKLMEAQKMILAELRTEFGGSAKAAGETLGGALAILGNQASNLLEAIGGALSPAIKVLGQLFGGVVDALIPLAPALAIAAVAMGALALAASPVVAALLPILAPIALITGAVALLKSAWENDFLGIRTAVTEAYNTIKPELDKIGAAFSNIMSIMNTGQAPGEVGPERFEPTEGKMGGGAGSAKAKKSDFGERLAKAIDTAWPQVEAAIGALGVKLGPAITKLWDSVKPAIETGVQQLVGLIGPLVNQHIVAPFLAELVKLDPLTMFSKLTQFFVPGGGFSTMFKDLGAQIDIQGALNTSLTAALEWLKGAGKTLWDSTFGILVDAASGLMGKIGGALVGSVKAGLKDVLRAIGGLSFIPGMGGVSAGIKAAMDALDGKAGGGSVMGGKSYVVGERGPEIFTPGASGGITPNNRIGGGGTTIINLNAYGVNDSASLVRKVNRDLKNRNRRTI